MANAGESLTATDPNREDSTGVIVAGQTVSYLKPTDIFINDWPLYITPYESEIPPAHRRKNPFEHVIFGSIVSRHNVCVKNIAKNVTFKRVNMKGFG